MSCPVCNMLKGKRLGFGNLCDDCKHTKGMRDLISNYRLTREHLFVETWYVFGTPLIVVAGLWSILYREHKVELGNIVLWMLVVLIWYKVVFSWNGKMKCSLKDLREKKAQYRDEIFICKCASEKEEED
jgi:hypothetical protein